jgi:hypothetical protein
VNCKRKKCGKEITRKENKLNSGFCDDCLKLALAAWARKLNQDS